MGQATHDHQFSDTTLLTGFGVMQNRVNGFLFGVFNKSAGIDNHRLIRR
jgi:hypothetical protein